MDNNIPSPTVESINNSPPPIPPYIPPKAGLRFNRIFLLIGVIVITIIVGSGGYLLGMKKPKDPTKPDAVSPTAVEKACTLDAKICPDGSSVSRVAPDCEFAPCPTMTEAFYLSPSPYIVSPSVSLVSTPALSSQTLINNLSWKIYKCKYGGYFISIPDELGINMFDGFGGRDPDCPREINGGITVYSFPEDLLNMPDKEIKEIKNVRINGINAKYAKVDQIDNGKVSKHLIMYQFENKEYVYLILDLDYKDPNKELDFYKDTQWDEMVDEYNKAQNPDQSPIDLVSVFDKMASTIKIIPPQPTPTYDPILPVAAKPVIYLYPEKRTEISVKVIYDPGFAATYPQYRNGWTVIADSQGKLIDNYDGKEYSYLYWEGNPDPNAIYDLSTGFVVKGEETADFLQKKLSIMGLTPKEYNEFIVYWYPKMKQNKYNLIHFATKAEYADRAVMEITPKPESLFRVFMVYKPLNEFIRVEQQVFSTFQRQGFTVIEWGGSELQQ